MNFLAANRRAWAVFFARKWEFLLVTMAFLGLHRALDAGRLMLNKSLNALLLPRGGELLRYDPKMMLKVNLAITAASQMEFFLGFLLLGVAFAVIAQMIVRQQGLGASLMGVCRIPQLYWELLKLGAIYIAAQFVRGSLITWLYHLTDPRGESLSRPVSIVLWSLSAAFALFLSRYVWGLPAMVIDHSEQDRVIELSRPAKWLRTLLFFECIGLYPFWTFGVSQLGDYLLHIIDRSGDPSQIAAKLYAVDGLTLLLNAIPLAYWLVLLTVGCVMTLEQLEAADEVDVPSPA